MSQHYFETVINDKPTLFMLGWDKPMQEVYLLAGYYTDDRVDWVHPMLLEVTIPFDRENNMVFFDEITVYLKGNLQRLELALPETMFTALENDTRNNTVNEMHQHFTDKAAIALDENPFQQALQQCS